MKSNRDVQLKLLLVLLTFAIICLFALNAFNVNTLTAIAAALISGLIPLVIGLLAGVSIGRREEWVGLIAGMAFLIIWLLLSLFLLIPYRYRINWIIPLDNLELFLSLCVSLLWCGIWGSIGGDVGGWIRKKANA